MSWDTDFPLAELAGKIINLRLRSERALLAQRIQRMEALVQAQGGDIKELRDARKALRVTPLAPREQADPYLVLPRKPKGVWRKRYLAVRSKPGSVF